MLAFLFPLLALCGAITTVCLAPLSPWWAPLFFLSYLLGLYLTFILFAILISPFFSKKKKPKRPNKLARFILVEVYSFLVFLMRIHVRTAGKENLPPKGSTFLVVCNHLSNFDHALMLVKLRRFPLAFISKPENFSIPVVGRYLWNSGFLSIDRKSARNALSTVNETASRIASGGMCYGVFPEGTRSRTGKLLPFHSGVFLSATKAKAPILVVHVHGTERIIRRAPWKSTRVELNILSYLDTDYTTTHTDAEISQYTYDMMSTQYPQSSES